MPLNPQDIVRKEFREAFRGYNQSDVDLFLDEVVEEFTRFYEDNQKMKVRLAALQQEVARLREGRGGTGTGALVAGPPPANAAGTAPDPQRIEAEVRARMRRFFEEQLRALEGAPTQKTATAERVQRELPRTETQPIPQRQARPAPPVSTPAEPAKKQTREPFWAGE